MNDNETNTATATDDKQIQQELRKKYSCNSYSDFLFSNWCSGGAVCANLTQRLGDTLDQIHGDTSETWDAEYFEPLQWWIIHRPSFALNHTTEPIFYDTELDVYAWPRLHGNHLTQAGYAPTLYEYGEAPRGLFNSKAEDTDDDTDDDETDPADD